MITEEILKAAGYRQHKQAAYQKEYTDDFYQKKVMDEYGTCYFIDFWHYPPMWTMHGTWLLELNLNEPHSTFEIHRPTDLEFCERKAKEFWIMMGGVYYERNETTTTV